MTYLKSGQPFLYDDDTGDIVGFRNPDTGKDTDLVLPVRNSDGSIAGLNAGGETLLSYINVGGAASGITVEV